MLMENMPEAENHESLLGRNQNPRMSDKLMDVRCILVTGDGSQALNGLLKVTSCDKITKRSDDMSDDTRDGY